MPSNTPQDSTNTAQDTGATVPAQDKPNTGTAHMAQVAKAKVAQVGSAPLPVWAVHRNPKVARVLATLARASAGDKDAASVALAKYGSAAALCRACGVQAKADQREVRQVLRDAGMGVGRGNTYTGQVGRKLATAARHNTKAAAKAAKATRDSTKA